ncbi:MAG: ABC transporter ATP-binding protein [Planctomycetia bacterium]|nr:ABC transporter ATP-binding protein [Planctomycetia bacterium]
MNQTTTTTPAIRVEHLTKTFATGGERITVLSDLELTIDSGEFVALMGASGSGKSTLLHIVAGLDRPDHGTVSIHGGAEVFNPFDPARSDHDRTVQRRHRIGIVFQAFNLIPTLTVEQNILLPVLADGKSPTKDEPLRRRLEELLERLGLADRRTARPDTLSGGEQQRTAIARALITNAPVLLADEPTGNLDSVNGQKLCEILRSLRDAERRTILLVTHRPSRFTPIGPWYCATDESSRNWRTARSPMRNNWRRRTRRPFCQKRR